MAQTDKTTLESLLKERLEHLQQIEALKEQLRQHGIVPLDSKRIAEKPKRHSLPTPLPTTYEDCQIGRKSFGTFGTYGKRSGTTDYGKQYEHLMCAFYALKFATSEDVLDFELTTNHEIYGDFDDIAIKASFRNRTEHTYLLQLKHTENKKRLTETILMAEKGDFSLGKYLKSFRNMDDRDNVSFILFTNRTAFFKKHTTFAMKDLEVVVAQNKDIPGEELLDTCWDDKQSVFQFATQDDDETARFLDKFFLFANQKNVPSIKTSIGESLHRLLCCDTLDSFLNFMKNWWCGNFILTKDDIISKLAELAFSSSIQTISSSKATKRSTILTEAIMSFDLTLVDNGDDVVCHIWDQNVDVRDASLTALKFGLTTKGITNLDDLTPEQKTKTLWYLNQVPLVVKPNEFLTRESVIRVTSLLGTVSKKKKVVLVNCVGGLELPWTTFKSLRDLLNTDLYEDIISSFEVSLQGRTPIALKQLFNRREDSQIITTQHLLAMSQSSLLVGDKKIDLPESYISRRVSVTLLDVECVIYTTVANKDIAVVVGSRSFQEFLKARKIPFLDLNEFERDCECSIFVASKCTKHRFDSICRDSNRRRVHVLQLVDEKTCFLVLSSDNVFGSEDAKRQRQVEESRIYETINAPISVLCAQPGIGKSTLIKFLANSCPPDVWSVKVNLRRFNSLLREEPEEEEILLRFLELDQDDGLLHNTKKLFVENRRIYLFLDGLDEIESNCVDFALDYVNYIAATGVRVWISSRLNLQAVITTRLNIFPIDVEELTQDQQLVYLHQRLEAKYKPEDISQISEQVFSSANVTNSHNMLGIPLQLFIITENFLNDVELVKKLTEEIFVLTKMYTIFFEGKKKHLYEKAGVLNEQQLGFNFSLHLELYETPALKCCLDDNTFDKLGLKLTGQEMKFLDGIKNEGDNFGIISQVNDDYRAVFTHQTFAEYFACVWLRKNFQKMRLLEEDIHSERYQNLRLIFDIMLAENCPLHLAVIYRNLEQVKKHLQELTVRDEGGRSGLHLICCYGSKHEELQLGHSLYLNHLYHEENHFDGESRHYKHIFSNLTRCSALEPDLVFGWTPLEYAVKFQCLYAVEQLLQSQNDQAKLNFLYKTFKTVHLAYYASKLGYPRLLTAAVTRNPNVVYFRIGDNKLSFLHVAVKNANHEHVSHIIKILIVNGVSVNVRDRNGIAPLHLAVKNGNEAIVTTLLDHEADVNASTYNDETVIHFALHFWHQQKKFFTSASAKDRNGTTSLHWACIDGDYDLVKTLVQNCADINARTSFQETVLHYAVRAWRPDLDIIALLLERGAEVDASDSFGTRPLHWACDHAHYDVIKLLHRFHAQVTISSGRTKSSRFYQPHQPNMRILDLVLNGGFNVNARSSTGASVLHCVAQTGHYGISQLLIAHGACITSKTLKEESVLHFAAQGSCCKLIKTLVELGIDPNTRDVNGETPLHVAAECGQYQAVETLLAHGASIFTTTFNNESVLTFAIKISRPNTDIIALLLQKGADVNCKDQDGISALHWASERGHHEIVKILLDHDADVNSVTSTGETALHYAAPNLEMIHLLLEKGVNVNGRDVEDMTALHWAAERGQLGLVKLLVDSGAEVNARNCRHESVLIHAVKQRKVNVEVIKLLVRTGADINASDSDLTTSLHWASEKRHSELVKLLLDAGSDVNVRTKKMETCLHHAARSWLPNTNIIKRLVAAGVDINAQNEEGVTALHLASKESDFVNVQLLVELGADVRLKTTSMESVLHFASKAWKINTNVMELLIEKGVEVDGVDSWGKTPLLGACEKGFLDNVEFLLDHGATLHSASLHFAVYGGHVKIVKLLLSRGLDVTKVDVRNCNLPLHFAQRNGVLREEFLTMMAATIRSRFPLLSWNRYTYNEVTTYLQEARLYLKPPPAVSRNISTTSSHSRSSISHLGSVVLDNVSQLQKFCDFFSCRRQRKQPRTPTFIVHYPEFPEDVCKEQENRTTEDRSYDFLLKYHNSW